MYVKAGLKIRIVGWIASEPREEPGGRPGGMEDHGTLKQLEEVP